MHEAPFCLKIFATVLYPNSILTYEVELKIIFKLLIFSNIT